MDCVWISNGGLAIYVPKIHFTDITFDLNREYKGDEVDDCLLHGDSFLCPPSPPPKKNNTFSFSNRTR